MNEQQTHSPTARRSGATLTERYVHAATRTLPEDQRADVAEELHASIADRVESLLGSSSPADAEYAALEELGDPDRLAAGYTGRRLQLIGPEVYPAYVRVLKGVLVGVVPVVTIVIAVIAALDGSSLGGIIGEAVWMALTVAVHVFFWVTLAFALAERGTSTDDLRESMQVEWAPDQLPELPHRRGGTLGELVSSLVWLGFVAGALVWQHFGSHIGDDLPVLDPDLWSFWLPLVLVLIAAEGAFEVVKYRRGWSPALASVNVVLGGVFAAPFVYLAATDRLLNPAAVTEIQRAWPEFDPGLTHLTVLLVSLAIWAWDSIDGWLRTRAVASAAAQQGAQNR